MRKVKHVDKEGRRYEVEIPDNAPDANSRFGIRVGPPDLSELRLPKEVEIRLNNALYDRRLLMEHDIRTRRADVFGALQAAYTVDVGAIVEIYIKTNQVGVAK